VNKELQEMTRDEFEKQYADKSGVTIEWLHEQGQFASPCYCGEEGCDGWKIINTKGMTRVCGQLIEGMTPNVDSVHLQMGDSVCFFEKHADETITKHVGTLVGSGITRDKARVILEIDCSGCV